MTTENMDKICPHLIQRARMRQTPGGRGLDALLSYEYMGSAEFEYGALPAALKRIRAAGKVAIVDTPHATHKGERIYLLVNQPDPAPYLAALALVAEGKARLKETAYLREVLSGRDRSGRPAEHPTCVWWDIKNDWLAVLGEDRARAVQVAINGP